jgi:uncharacterized protein
MTHVETHSAALRAWLIPQRQVPLVSSLLARVETARALHRTDPEAVASLPAVVGSINLIAISETACATAAAYPDRLLRSLDAIHLATAAMLGSALTSFVTYDRRLAAVAEATGLPVAAPT